MLSAPSTAIPKESKITSSANTNDTTTQAVELALGVEVAASVAERVSAIKNKKNQSIQTN